jgi:hypothetical protein
LALTVIEDGKVVFEGSWRDAEVQVTNEWRSHVANDRRVYERQPAAVHVKVTAEKRDEPR